MENEPNDLAIELSILIRKIIIEELGNREQNNLIHQSDFCKNNNISRTTIWRMQKEGKLKIIKLGRKVFIQTNQFI